MATWSRIRHARMTEATEGLPNATYKILGTLRRLIPDGQTRWDLSQADIAVAAQVSEATVSLAMPDLERRGFITRKRPTKFVRGVGYGITMIPLPEIRHKLPPDGMPEKGSLSDPSQHGHHEQVSGTRTPETPSLEGSLSDPSNNILHESHGQQQDTPSPCAVLTEQLTRKGAHPRVLERILSHPQNRERTINQFEADLAAASARRGVEDPFALTLEVWAAGQRVHRPRGRKVPQNARSVNAQIDTAAYRGQSGFGVGDDLPAGADLPAADQADAATSAPPRALTPPRAALDAQGGASAPPGDRWAAAVAALRMQMTRSEFEAVEQAALLRCDQQCAVIACSTAAQKAALEQRHALLRRALGVVTVQIIIGGGRR